jgi:hypothetical protein
MSQLDDADSLPRQILQVLGKLYVATPVLVLLADANGVTSVIFNESFDREQVQAAMKEWAERPWNASKSF